MTTLKTPDSLSLLGNIKSFLFQNSSEITFTLLKGNSVIIEETYFPDANQQIEIDIRDVIGQYIVTEFPTSTVHIQANAAASFTAKVDGNIVATFTVINGGVRNISSSASEFCKTNWLTWQPQSKQVLWNSPEFLTYYFTTSGKIIAKFYHIDDTTETVELYSGAASDYVTLNVSLNRVMVLSTVSVEELYGIVDIYVEDTSGIRLTYIQRYVLQSATDDYHTYFCVNSLGGIDTFTFFGARTSSMAIEHESAERGNKKISITPDAERQWQQNTGYLGSKSGIWLLELLSSKQQWTILNANVESIVLDASSIQISDKDNLNAASFNFSLSSEGKLLNVIRDIDEQPLIKVPSPTGDLFFLAPRVVDYPDAVMEDSLLFLVQSPYIQEWKKISLGTIKHWIKEILLPYENLPLRLEILTDGDGFLAWGEKTSITCKVWKGLYQEVTSEVTAWEISRNSGVPIEDAAWLTKDKVRAFFGSIDICFTMEENDLGETSSATGTTFTIKAHIENHTASAAIVI